MGEKIKLSAADYDTEILYLSENWTRSGSFEYKIQVNQSTVKATAPTDQGRVGQPNMKIICRNSDGFKEWTVESWSLGQNPLSVAMDLAEEITYGEMIQQQPTIHPKGKVPSPPKEKQQVGNEREARKAAAIAQTAGLKARLAALGQNVFPTFPKPEVKPAEVVATPTVPQRRQGRGGK